MNIKIRILLVLCIVIGLGALNLSLGTFSKEWCQTADSRAFTPTDRFKFSWLLNNVILDHYTPSYYDSIYNVPFFVDESYLFAVGFLDCSNQSLLKINTDGDVEIVGFSNFGINRRITGIVSHEDIAYLALSPSRNVNPTTNPNAQALGKIIAYNSQSDRILWETKMPGIVGSLFVNDTIVTTNIELDGTEFYVLDRHDGEIVAGPLLSDNQLASSPANINATLYAIANQFIQVSENDPFVTSRILNTVDTLSDSASSLAINHPIKVSGNYLVIKHGRYHPDRTSSLVVVRDRQSGEWIWDTADEIVSNISVNTHYIFYVTKESKVVVRNLENGEEAGYIQFSSEPADRFDIPYVFIEANGESSIFIYFRDSSQIFAFEFNP